MRTDTFRHHASALRLTFGGLLALALPLAAWAQSTADDFFNRGLERKAKGDLDGAIADYSKVLELDPKGGRAHNNRGLARQEKGDLDGAMADFGLALQIDPKNSNAAYNRGLARKAKGELDGAIADFTRVLELDPKDNFAVGKRGLAKEAKGDLDGAIADYTRAIELDPKYIEAYNNRGIARRTRGDLDGAIADYTRAIELDPKYLYAYNNRGLAKRSRGDLDGAIADCTRAVELDPKYAPACYQRGIAFYLKHRWTDALTDLRRSCELDGGQDFPQLLIWLIRSRLGETDAADKELAGYMDKRTNGTAGDWSGKVAGFLFGKISEADLMNAAASPDANKARRQRCEASFYAGMKRLLSGDKPAAAAHFRKCRETEFKSIEEYQFAGDELKALGN